MHLPGARERKHLHPIKEGQEVQEKKKKISQPLFEGQGSWGICPSKKQGFHMGNLLLAM